VKHTELKHIDVSMVFNKPMPDHLCSFYWDITAAVAPLLVLLGNGCFTMPFYERWYYKVMVSFPECSIFIHINS
jgi:hypothetical protein